MELDLYIPALDLALEYQGSQHYSSWSQRRDDEKMHACSDVGLTLVRVPYWWNGNQLSVAATIHRSRPDLLPDLGSADTAASVPAIPEIRDLSSFEVGENWVQYRVSSWLAAC